MRFLHKQTVKCWQMVMRIPELCYLSSDLFLQSKLLKQVSNDSLCLGHSLTSSLRWLCMSILVSQKLIDTDVNVGAVWVMVNHQYFYYESSSTLFICSIHCTRKRRLFKVNISYAVSNGHKLYSIQNMLRFIVKFLLNAHTNARCHSYCTPILLACSYSFTCTGK